MGGGVSIELLGAEEIGWGNEVVAGIEAESGRDPGLKENSRSAGAGICTRPAPPAVIDAVGPASASEAKRHGWAGSAIPMPGGKICQRMANGSTSGIRMAAASTR